jgi:hypothetical protein
MYRGRIYVPTRVVGGVAGLVQMDGADDAAQVVPLLGAAGGFVLIIMLVLSVPGIVAGIGLLSFQPWDRAIHTVDLLSIPLGAILGPAAQPPSTFCP